jgi:hypothetical protein
MVFFVSAICTYTYSTVRNEKKSPGFHRGSFKLIGDPLLSHTLARAVPVWIGESKGLLSVRRDGNGWAPFA